jgi:hypothetical protein
MATLLLDVELLEESIDARRTRGGSAHARMHRILLVTFDPTTPPLPLTAVPQRRCHVYLLLWYTIYQ